MADLGIIFLRRRYPIHWYQSSYIFITGSMPFRYVWATLYKEPEHWQITELKILSNFWSAFKMSNYVICIQSNWETPRLHMCMTVKFFYVIMVIANMILKPMDSFGICGENQMKLFFFIESYCYSSVWIVNALSIFCSEMLKLSRNNPNIKIFGIPPNTLQLVIYIGIFCYWVLLHYNMSFKTIAGAFWWYFVKIEKKNVTYLPKLSCGFKSLQDELNMYIYMYVNFDTL